MRIRRDRRRAEERRAAGPASRAFLQLSEGNELAAEGPSAARKAVVVLIAALYLLSVPLLWANSADAGKAVRPAASGPGPDGSGGDDDNSGPGGGDDSDENSADTATFTASSTGNRETAGTTRGEDTTRDNTATTRRGNDTRGTTRGEQSTGLTNTGTSRHGDTTNGTTRNDIPV